MTAPSLHTLPPELQTLAAGFLWRKSDLRNVCLTNKSLCAAATPILYESVHVNLDIICYPHLSSFFEADNAGHRYVRTLLFS